MVHGITISDITQLYLQKHEMLLDVFVCYLSTSFLNSIVSHKCLIVSCRVELTPSTRQYVLLLALLFKCPCSGHSCHWQVHHDVWPRQLYCVDAEGGPAGQRPNSTES